VIDQARNRGSVNKLSLEVDRPEWPNSVPECQSTGWSISSCASAHSIDRSVDRSLWRYFCTHRRSTGR